MPVLFSTCQYQNSHWPYLVTLETLSHALCEQQNRCSVCTYVLFDQGLCCSLLRKCNTQTSFTKCYHTSYVAAVRRPISVFPVHKLPKTGLWTLSIKRVMKEYCSTIRSYLCMWPCNVHVLSDWSTETNCHVSQIWPNCRMFAYTKQVLWGSFIE